MSRSDDLRVADIVEAAQQLGELVAAGRGAFDADWTRQRAAERLLEIIGEASNALSDGFKKEHPDVSWRHIINLSPPDRTPLPPGRHGPTVDHRH